MIIQTTRVGTEPVAIHLGPARREFTLSLWVRPEGNNGINLNDGQVAFWSDSQACALQIATANNVGQNFFVMVDHKYESASYLFANRKWQHIAVTRNLKGVFDFYVDGEIVCSFQLADDPFVWGTAYIGARHDQSYLGVDSFTGQLLGQIDQIDLLEEASHSAVVDLMRRGHA